jgi:hypothetical protein
VQRLPEIKAAYDRLVDLLRDEVVRAVAAGDTSAEGNLVETQRILDYAFFVLCFAQFERHVTDVFEAARDRRISNPDWTRRRGWDIDNYRDSRRVRFEDRVALVLDRSGDDYAKVIADYHKRNHVAHGGLTEPIASADQFVQELFDVSSRLQT